MSYTARNAARVTTPKKKSFQFREIKEIHNSFFPPEKNKPKHFSLFLMIIDE